MPLPNLYGSQQPRRAAIQKAGPRDYMNPGYDQYDEGIAYFGGGGGFDEPGGFSGGGSWPTTNSGFGGAGTDPGVGSPGFYMPTIEGPGGPGSSQQGDGFQMPEWLTNLIGGGGSNGGMTPQQIAYLAATTGFAGKQWNDAGQIEDRFNQVADQADYLHPDRMKYAGQLAGLMADPSSIEKDPSYQFRLGQGLNTLGPQQAAKGGGYGNAAKAMIDYAGNAASQELNAQTDRLSRLAGFQFDQGKTAADLRTAGLTGSIQSQNNALGTLGFGLQNIFGSQPGGMNNGGGNNGGSGGNRGGFGGDNQGGGGNPGRGTWNEDGTYRTPSGQNLNVSALAAAARAGDPAAIRQLFEISGGRSVDEAIQNLGTGDIRDGTGTSTGDPYNPEIVDDGGYTNPDGGYGGGNTYDPGPEPAPYYEDYPMDDWNPDFGYSDWGF